MAKKAIVYIAGYGRSGSTLLARILDSHENIFATGELINFLDLIDRQDLTCSCGQQIRDCTFWAGILQKFKQEVGNTSALTDIQKKFESFFHLFWHLRARNSGKAIRLKQSIQHQLECIFQNLPPQVQYVVDSSKTTWSRFFRPMMLSRIGAQKVKVIHIVRDGRGCMWSMMKGTDTGLLKHDRLNKQSSFPALRTAVHWPFANLAAHLFQATHPAKDYCRIRYEDLVENPVETCSGLGKFLGVCLDQQIEILKNGADIHPGHLMAGNRMRSSTLIKVKPDIEWEKRLKLRYKLIFWFINWPMMIFYKYR